MLRGRGVDPKAALAHGPAVRTVFLLAALFAAPLAPPPGAAAQDASLAARARAVGADPMELARIARDADEAVLAALADAAETARAERWAAARVAPWIDAPERALAPLAAIAGGDDPLLAPVAAEAGWAIASRLEPGDLAAREVPLAPLREARGAWAAVAADESARADLRRLAAFTADALGQLAPEPAAEPAE
ncbi:MAG: hypothetical protein CMH59_21325 [Myxococcales bacterium]|nr:hypothetical protein [Myxococcales bacterium]